jgi:hypothetical protein
LCQSEFANSCSSRCFVSIASCRCELALIQTEAEVRGPLFYAVGACSSFALLSLARFPLSLEFLIHLSYLQLGKMYACLLSVCVCVCMSFQLSIFLKS